MKHDRLPLSDFDSLKKALIDTANGVSSRSGENIFHVITKTITDILNVDYAFIGELVVGKKDTVHAFSVVIDHRIAEPFEYQLDGTPCKNVIGQDYQFYRENVQNIFPDPHVKELQVEGYAAIPLFDSHSRSIGMMAVMHRKPIEEPALTEALLKIFSVRAAVELERIYANRALVVREASLRATLEVSLDCIIAMDHEGNIIEFNPAAEACFGLKKFDVLGQSLAETIIPERYRDAHTKGMKRYAASRKANYLGKRVELVAMRSDGSEFPVELAIGVATTRDGDIYIGYLRDITEQKKAEAERKKLEDQLRQAQKMEAIGHLTGGIAHDFNNILTTVMGYIVMAQEREQIHGDEKLSKYLDRISHAGIRARDLIQQMLTFSRGQRGERKSLSPGELVNETVNLLRPALPSTIEINTTGIGLKSRILADPIQMEQILMNLCINARDAMEGQGQLTLGLSDSSHHGEVCSSCKQIIEDEYVEICVCDTGSGIANEHLDRIFEPFYSTKETGKGSGMGLATVHGIVHDHNGHIVVDTQLGKGTRFKILLPCYKSAHEANPGSSTGTRTDETGMPKLIGKVLLVDDEEMVAEFMTDLLEEWGLHTVYHSSPDKALTDFQSRPDFFDLVITDQTMPQMTGTQFSQKVQVIRPDIPILLYTGYSDTLTAEDVSSLGIKAFMRKPIDHTQLYSSIQELIE